MKLPDTLSLVLVLSVALTLVLWLRVPRPRGSLLENAGWLFLAAFVLELSGFITRFYCWNNAPMYNAFQLFEFVMVLLLIATAEPSLKRIAWVLALLGTAAFIVIMVRQGDMAILATEAILVFSTILSFMLMRSLYLLAKHCEVPLHRLPAFWLFMGCLVYFGSLVYMLGGIRLIFAMNKTVAHEFWFIIPSLAIIRYLFTAWACHLAIAQKRS